MTNFTPEQIREAGGSEKLIQRLENPVEFGEGQVVRGVSTLYPYHLYDKNGCNSNCRHLTLTELSPAVGALVDTVESILDSDSTVSLSELREALEAFRRTHGS